VILLDASALIAYLAGEPAADRVADLLSEGGSAITSVNLAECLDILMRVRGIDFDRLESAIVPLLVSALSIVPIGEAEARAAAVVRQERYHRVRAPLSMADCLLLAVATLNEASIVTTDNILASSARQQGIDVVLLPRVARKRS
jgi:predicted nucleic acid-binding protein